MTEIETPHDSWRKLYSNPFLQGFVLMALAAVIAIWMQVPGRFADPDAFYHAGMAELAAEGTFPATFPWLDMTTLRDRYADLHFVYHLILVPFVALFGPLHGIRIATIAALVLLVGAFIMMLRAFHVRGAFVFTLLLLGSAPFMFRANLAKAQGFAFLILFLGLTALAKRASIGVFLAALFATWTSTHWPVFAIAVALFGIMRVGVAITCQPTHGRELLTSLREAAWFLLLTGAGIAVAFVVNPYFPNILTVAKQQILDIAANGPGIDARVGSEWAPLAFREFLIAIHALIPVTVLAFGGTIALLLRGLHEQGEEHRRDAVHALIFGFLALVFGFLTLRARRHLEFFVPFIITFAAIGMQPIIAWMWPPRVAIGWRRPGIIRRGVFSLALVIVLVGFGLGSFQGLAAQRASFQQGFPYDRLADAAAWIRENVPAQEIIFHGDWDDFPSLFLYDRTHRYLLGLDPRFAVLEDPERFATWLALNRGEIPDARVVQTIRSTFGARYAMIDAEQDVLNAQLAKHRNARRVFESASGNVYELR